ncbi:MAG TPA: MarR family transcriptional regulator [Desulfosporosinus sp.]
MGIDQQELLAQDLAQLMIQIKRLVRQAKSTHEIKPSEFTLLHTIIQCKNSDAKGIKASDLSSHLLITPAGVTHTINSLEEGGYLERLSDPSDRRIVLVRATAKGEEIIESMRMEHFKALKGLTNSLGEHDTQELIRLMSLSLNYFKEKR